MDRDQNFTIELDRGGESHPNDLHPGRATADSASDIRGHLYYDFLYVPSPLRRCVRLVIAGDNLEERNGVSR